ncbi:PREDICTED: aminopeptidase N-like isoform X2 [Vollenhovia emeryi]|uniref:aminopeptidase N-like isoform X2 n=1 Tax=Vollenhovia emeryi TaxID=411798 RepID=UPI0005F4EC03|nr:PREDICTED: aminopeptidase N-like isoform X2 [Vollenhovia emeryi]
MKILKLLLDVSLIFISVKAANNHDSLTEVHDSINRESITVTGYDIILVPFVNENDYKRMDIPDSYENIEITENLKSYIDEQVIKGNSLFYGQLTMHFRCKSKINTIRLHTQNLKIDDEVTTIMYTDIRSDDRVARSYKPRMHKYDNETQTVVLTVDDVDLHKFIAHRLIMKFVGSITYITGAFVKTFYKKHSGKMGSVIAAADFQGAGARQLFPCLDEPNIRTKFTISVRHRENHAVISNEAISVYLPTVDIWGRTKVKPQTKFAEKIISNATKYMDKAFSMLNLPPAVTHVIMPGFRDVRLESWGLIIYSEAIFLYNEKVDFIAWKLEVGRMVARKIVHQFYGNLISQPSWSYMWLNEGIASYLAMEIISQYVYPHYKDLLTVQLQYEYFRLNEYYDMPLMSEITKPSDISSSFSFTYYIKAPVFIYTVVHIHSLPLLTPSDAFQNALKKYLITYRLRSIDSSTNTIDIFFNVLQNFLSPKLDIKLTEKVSQWVKQKRYAVLRVTRSSETTLNSTQEYLNQSHPKISWLPGIVTIKYFHGNTEQQWHNLQEPIIHLQLDNKYSIEWFLVNRTGFYRVNYDYYNWRKLMEYLNSENYLGIDVVNRAQIIDDAYYFLLNNELNFTFFKNLTLYLSNETNYVAWYPMFKILEEMSAFFPFPESAEVKEHFQKILESLLEKIGYIEVGKGNIFDKSLQYEAAKWACTLNSSKCLDSASVMLSTYYKLAHGTVPGWKEWIYCEGMKTAYVETWSRMWNASFTNKKLLKFLTCSENSTIIINYIHQLKSGYFIGEYGLEIFHSIIARHAKNNFVLDYILENFSHVIPREIKTIVALTDIINHLYTADQLTKVTNFVRINFSSHIFFMQLSNKTRIRLTEIQNHVSYFKSFLETKF